MRDYRTFRTRTKWTLAVIAVVVTATTPVEAATKTTKKAVKTAVTTKAAPSKTIAPTASTVPARAATLAPADAAAKLALLTSPIKVLIISPEDSPSTNFPDAQIGARAAAAAVNKAGGVRGAKIEVTWCNDKSDPNETLACARKASDGFAAVSYAGRIGPTAWSVIKGMDIAFFNGAPASAAEFADPHLMVFDGASPGQYGPAAYATVTSGFKRIACVRSTIAQTITICDYIKQVVAANGGTVLPDIVFPAVFTDGGPTASAIKASGADAVCLVSNAVATAAIISALNQQGVDVQKCLGDGALTLNDINRMGTLLDGSFLGGDTPPLVLQSRAPSIDKYIKDVIASGFEPRDALGISGVRAYAMVHAVAQVAATLPTVDAKSLLNGLNSSKALSVPVFGQWLPSGRGPAGFERVSNMAGYASRFKGQDPVLIQTDPIDLSKWIKG